MKLETATQSITQCADEMNRRYGRTVFDEWVIVSFIGNREEIVGYVGPRPESLQRDFVEDLHALKEELFSARHAVGEFEFARAAGGTHFDAFIVLGDWLYLICNNTTQAIDKIAAEPAWKQAQVPFVELSERFRADPLRLV
jgi:hypothetical protein